MDERLVRTLEDGMSRGRHRTGEGASNRRFEQGVLPISFFSGWGRAGVVVEKVSALPGQVPTCIAGALLEDNLET